MRVFRALLLGWLIVAAPPVLALGLGDITLHSALNEPFDADIALISVRAEDADNISVSLASPRDFAQAGVERPLVLAFLRFKVVPGDIGKTSIKVSSRKPIREPFLNFLVEVNWSSGRSLREYTVLLDPPIYAERKAPPVTPAVAAPAPLALSTAVPESVAPSVAAAPSSSPAPTPPAPSVSAAQDQRFPHIDIEAPPAPTEAPSSYGPTKYADTLWSIANRVRPDTSVTTEQMMQALLEANPHAFADDNVNNLKAGYVLRVPDLDTVRAISRQQARAATRAQNDAWRARREVLAQEATPLEGRRDVTEAESSEPALAPSADAEVKLVAPTAETAQAGSGDGDEIAQIRRELQLTHEAFATMEQANTDLKARIGELETQIQSMERLLALKDETLADIQSRLAATEGTAPPAVPEAVAPQPAPYQRHHGLCDRLEKISPSSRHSRGGHFRAREAPDPGQESARCCHHRCRAPGADHRLAAGCARHP